MTGAPRTTRARLAVALSAGAAALVLAGCGGVPPDNADAEAGRGLFIANCGSCHVLEDAGTEGRIGPNLDDAFRGARQQGFEQSQIHAVTREWIALAQLPMPRDLVVGEDAENVAAYVAEVAGLSPASQARPAKADPGQEPPAISPEAESQPGEQGEAEAGGVEEAVREP